MGLGKVAAEYAEEASIYVKLDFMTNYQDHMNCHIRGQRSSIALLEYGLW